MNSTNNISARQSVDIAKSIFMRSMRDKFPAGEYGERQCREWVNSLVFTQSYIRLEVQLNTTSNAFTFGVNPQQANSNNKLFATEKRLPLQDTIIGTEMYLYVGNPSSEAATDWKLRTYGNTQDFSANAAKALDSTFYGHGELNVKMNQQVIMPGRMLADFHYRGVTQQTAPLGAGSADDQFRGAEDGGVTIEPNILFIGSANTQPQIVLPSALAAADTFQRAVLIIKGPYAQNSTVVN